ncbi:hypothetical protein VPH35_136155 [Triticum aestivum]
MTNLEMDKILALVHKLISRSPVPRGGRSLKEDNNALQIRITFFSRVLQTIHPKKNQYFSLDFSIRRVEDTSKDLGRLCIANGTYKKSNLALSSKPCSAVCPILCPADTLM